MIIKNADVIFVLQMVCTEISFSIRLLSWAYVNIWIPIRLTYLRTKIALRPVTNVMCEVVALLNMACCFVPISLMFVSSEIIRELAMEWLRLTCLCYEKAIGADPGSLYNKHVITAFAEDDNNQDEEHEETNDMDSIEQTDTTESIADKNIVQSADVGTNPINEPSSSAADEDITVND